MRLKAVRFLLILANAISLMLLASCSGLGEASTVEKVDDVTQPTTVAAVPTQALERPEEAQPAEDSHQADPMTFEDEDFGIRLAFTTSWEGFQVGRFEHESVTNLCFFFPTSSPICVLQLDVFTKEAWAGLEKVHPDYFLAENDTFVIAAGPFTQACVQMDAFQCERYLELPSILAGIEVQ